MLYPYSLAGTAFNFRHIWSMNLLPIGCPLQANSSIQLWNCPQSHLNDALWSSPTVNSVHHCWEVSQLCDLCILLFTRQAAPFGRRRGWASLLPHMVLQRLCHLELRPQRQQQSHEVFQVFALVIVLGYVSCINGRTKVTWWSCPGRLLAFPCGRICCGPFLPDCQMSVTHTRSSWRIASLDYS